MQLEQQVHMLRCEVNLLRQENLELSQRVQAQANQEHFQRLKESIGICLNKAFIDMEGGSPALLESIKRQSNPMQLLEEIERNLFEYCGLAEQQLNSLKMQVMKDRFEINFNQEQLVECQALEEVVKACSSQDAVGPVPSCLKAIDINFNFVGKELYEQRGMIEIRAQNSRAVKMSIHESSDQHAANARRGCMRMFNRSLSPLKSIDGSAR